MATEGGNDDTAGEPAGPATVATGDDLRIVSLLPSLTDIVAELGLAERVVGVTHECDNGLVLKRAGKGPVVVTESYIDPKAEQKEINDAVIESLAQNHSLYALKEDSLRPLAPTHVLTQSLCDVCAVAFEQVKSKCSRLLADKPYKLLSVEPSTLQDVRVNGDLLLLLRPPPLLSRCILTSLSFALSLPSQGVDNARGQQPRGQPRGH